MSRQQTAAARWTLVLPFRGGDHSKSRLASSLSNSSLRNSLLGDSSTMGRSSHQTARAAGRIALAMAFDTAAVTVASPAVGSVVLLSNALSTAELPTGLRSASQLRLCPEPPVPGSQDPLNDVLAQWLSTAGSRIAVVLPDLPALTPQALQLTLDAADTLLLRHESVFVPDASGTGTVMLAGPNAHGGLARLTRFGWDSARRHERAGVAKLEGAPQQMRLDVDTIEDLLVAHRLGLGRYTTEVLETLDRSFAAAG